MIGETIGDYKIVEMIGRGGWAEVYKAYDASVDRHVAIKVLLSQYSEDVELRIRFDREARAIALLEHLHILPLYAYGENDKMLYLVMRYMPTGTIADLIEDGEPMPLKEISRLLYQMANALDYAHGQGVLHRDLKPENVLLDGDRNAYLSDFGLAKMVQKSSRLTMNYIVGTPAFMSPEQCAGADDLTARSDQYALGLMVYTMVTGELAFDGGSPLAVIQKQINQPVPSIRQHRPELPALAEKAIVQAAAKNPDDRFPNCMAFAIAFEQAIAGSGLSRLDSQGIPTSLRNRIDSALANVQLGEDDEEE